MRAVRVGVVAGNPNLLTLAVIFDGGEVVVPTTPVAKPGDISAPGTIDRQRQRVVLTITGAVVPGDPRLLGSHGKSDGANKLNRPRLNVFKNLLFIESCPPAQVPISIVPD